MRSNNESNVRKQSSDPIRRKVSRAAAQMVETLEQRKLLAANPYATGNTPVFNPSTADLTDAKNGPLAKGGAGLVDIYRDYRRFVKSGATRFTSAYAEDYAIRGRSVGVTMRTRGSVNDLADAVRAMGGSIQYRSVARKVVVAYVPISQVDDLAGRKDIMHVRPMLRPHSNSVGAVENQAERAQKNNLITSAFGATGAGQHVGVISDSFGALPNGYVNDIATEDLPDDVDVLVDEPVGSDEGRAMLQLIHDIVPEAKLSFASSGFDPLMFADSVIKLGENGATVIVDDIVVFAEPFFQPGVLDRAIKDVVDNGTVYLTASGNYGASGYQGSSSFVEDTQDDSTGERVVDFDPSDGLDTRLSINFAKTGPIYFQWDNAYDGAVANVTSDLDVYLYREGVLIASATDDNFATGVPTERLIIPDSGDYELVIREHARTNGAADPTMFKFVGIEMFDARTDVEYVTETSTSAAFGHEVTRDGISVGAVPFDATEAYGRARSIQTEDFSAVATVIQTFDADGNRLERPQVYPGAIISGADGVNTSVPGFAPFFGTSAAAPNVAALVAQLRHIAPDTTPAEILEVLIASAKNNPLNDARSGVRDLQGGFGLVDAVFAANMVNGNIPVATFDLPTTKPGKLGSVTVTFSEPVTGVDIGDFILTRDGTSKSRFSGTETVRDTGDGTTYVIENLGSATKSLGVYTLSLLRSRTGITDADGNAPAGQVESFAITLRRVQDLSARKLDDGDVRLSWTDTNSGEDGYRIQRATDPDFTNDLFNKSLSAGVSEYTDADVEAGEIYYYRVRGVKDGRLGDTATTSIANGSEGEIFLDNSDARFSGNWEILDRASALLGSVSRATSTNELSKPKTATFATDQIADGNYFLYVRYAQSDRNASNATFEVYRGTKLAKSVRVDQTNNGNGWVLLGGFVNDESQPLSVRLTSKLADGAVNVDAVRFLPADEATVANYRKKQEED